MKFYLGLLLYLQNNDYLLFSFLLRILTAVGADLSQTATISILCYLYPNHVSISFGLLELASGVGLMIGPTLGGASFIMLVVLNCLLL